MAVGKGSILRAASAAVPELGEEKKGKRKKAAETPEPSEQEMKKTESINDDKAGEQAITSLRDDMPIYLL